MGDRTTKGELTAEALAAGKFEQYACVRAFGVVVVELHGVALEPGARAQWVVKLTISDDDGSTRGVSKFYSRLNEARRHFAKSSRKALKSDQPGLIYGKEWS